MDTRNIDIKISTSGTPAGLFEWTNEAVNQVICESSLIQTMINNLDKNGITVVSVDNHDEKDLLSPFLTVHVDGFVLSFSHVMHYGAHTIRVELRTINDIPNQLIFEMAFFCKFNYPITLEMEHKLELNEGLTLGVQLIELLPDESKYTAIKICEILKDTIENWDIQIQ